jgi:hypothetical protein
MISRSLIDEAFTRRKTKGFMIRGTGIFIPLRVRHRFESGGK